MFPFSSTNNKHIRLFTPNEENKIWFIHILALSLCKNQNIMKTSKYNYYLKIRNRSVIFNTLSESYFFLPFGKEDVYKQIIADPNRYIDNFAPFIKKLTDAGFIIEDSLDESALVDAKFQRLLCDKEYHLMILPTFNCNLRCWYCIQDHANISMTEQHIKEVKERILEKACSSDINTIRISWFGGEPLVSYDVVLDITSYAQSICKLKNKHFISDITTNGTLLTPERISALRAAGVTGYQITIDGCEEQHNKVKQLQNKSAFQTSLHNIELIAENSYCNLRFNYSADTLKPKEILEDLEKYLPVPIRKNIMFTLIKVWQEDSSKISSDKLNQLINGSKSMGLNVFVNPIGFCYVDKKNYEAFYPQGKWGKCENNVAERTASSTSVTDYNAMETDKYNPAYRNKSSECHDCKFLPICWGPCLIHRKAMMDKHNKILCHFNDKEDSIQKFITNLITAKSSNSAEL